MTSPLYERIGARIRALRKERGYTQPQLGALIGHRPTVVRQLMSATENGKRPVSLAELDRIAAALGVTISELLCEPPADRDGLRAEARRLAEVVRDTRDTLDGALHRLEALVDGESA